MKTSKIAFRDYPLVNTKLLWAHLAVSIIFVLISLIGIFQSENIYFDLVYPILGLLLLITSLLQLDQQLWRRFTPRVVISDLGLGIKYHWLGRLKELRWNQIDHINLIGNQPMIVTKEKENYSFHEMDYFNQLDLLNVLREKSDKLGIPVRKEPDQGTDKKG